MHQAELTRQGSERYDTGKAKRARSEPSSPEGLCVEVFACASEAERGSPSGSSIAAQ